MLWVAIEKEMVRSTKWRDTHLARAGKRCQTYLISTTGEFVLNDKALKTFNGHFIRHCVVADELNDRIYMIGGVNRRRNTYYYKPSSNSWHSMGSLYYDSYVSKKTKYLRFKLCMLYCTMDAVRIP